MNLRDFEYLVALAEHQHFGRAAAACYVSQPTLSTQLRKLERELGVELIERSPRQVTLTVAGQGVVARARTILQHAQEIRGIARQAQDPRSGSLRLGVFPTLAPYLLPHMIPPLHRRFPSLELLLVEEKTDELLQQLRTSRLDAALLALPVAEPSLRVEPVFRESFLVATPVGHPLTRSGRPVRAEDLRSSPVLLLEDGHCLREQALALCQTAGATLRNGFTATSLETLRHMVAAGVGITVMPRLSVTPPVAPSEGLALAEFAEPAPYRDIGMVWRPGSVYRLLLPELAQAIRDDLPDAVCALGPARTSPSAAMTPSEAIPHRVT